MLADLPDWLHEIDHTGDVGIRVTAGSLPQLFERAALGMGSVLADLDAVRPAEATALSVTARDHEALLVRWLSALNYRHTVENWIFSDVAVAAITEQDGEWALSATVRGEALDPARHTVHTEIKAITFHGLDVRETSDGWVVQVIFDL